MNIVLVTPHRVPGPKQIPLAQGNFWIRSALSELRSLSIDILIFMPGCSEEQRAVAIDKTRAVLNPEIFDLVPVTK